MNIVKHLDHKLESQAEKYAQQENYLFEKFNEERMYNQNSLKDLEEIIVEKFDGVNKLIKENPDELQRLETNHIEIMQYFKVIDGQISTESHQVKEIKEEMAK